MRLLHLLPLLILLALPVTTPVWSAEPPPEIRTIQGRLVTADKSQPLAHLRIAIGNTADARSIFGLVEHHVFAKGRTDAQGRFSLNVRATPEFKKASAQKTLLIVVFGNRDYLGVTLAQGEKPVYLVPKVVTVQ